MKSFTLLTAAVAAAATLATAASAPIVGAAVRPVAVTTPAPQVLQRTTAEQLRGDRRAVVYFRQKAWNVQDRITVPHTPTNYAERHWRSHAALHWLKHRWNGIWHKSKHFLAAHRLPLTNDWQTAVRIVQRVWPGTSDWLLSCSSGEGGHGVWIWNGGSPYAGTFTPPAGSSGAAGWMQFMRGTFTGAFSKAVSEARKRHWHLPALKGLPSVPAKTSAVVRAWLSPLAQAFAAGWARYHHATSAWDPGIDPACA